MNQPSLFSFPLVKLFTYFSFSITERTENYIAYGKSVPLYYVYLQAEEDHQAIFSTRTLQCINKDQLLYELAGKQPLDDMDRLLNEINTVVPLGPMPQIESYATTQQILTTVMDLRENVLWPTHWTRQPRFANRIFNGKRATFKMPLCSFTGKKFNRFLNCVIWDDNKRWYLNDNTSGFICSNSDENTCKLLITCNPRILETVSTSPYGHQYLYMLAHEHAKQNVFEEAIRFSKSFSYTPICIHTDGEQDIPFVCQFLNTYLFYSSPIPIWLGLHPGNMLTVSIHASQNDYEVLNSFLTQLNGEIEKHYNSNTLSSRLPKTVLKHMLPRLTRLRGTSTTRYVLEMDLDKAAFIILLHEIVHFFTEKGSIEILND